MRKAEGMLSDPYSDVRAGALEVLTKFATNGMFRTVVESASSANSSPEVHRTSIQVKLIEEKLGDSDSKVRKLAIQLLETLAPVGESAVVSSPRKI